MEVGRWIGVKNNHLRKTVYGYFSLLGSERCLNEFPTASVRMPVEKSIFLVICVNWSL